MKFGRQDVVVAGGTALLFLVSFAVFWPALRGEFLWDDLLNILSNPLIQSPRGLLDIWLGGRNVYDYYPMTWTTWWLEWRVWGRDTLGYHVLNVILHAGAAALMWRVLVRLALPGAFVAALIFAVHPVNVETVAWISERKNTLSMFLLAVTAALYLDADTPDQPQDTPRPRGSYWACVVTFALALLAKPSVVGFPVVLLVLAWWRRGHVTRADWLRSVPFFILSAGIAIVTILVHQSRGIVGSQVRTDGFFSRLVGAGWAAWFYLYKLVWPADLAFVYPRWELNPRDSLHWVPLAGLLVAFAALYLARHRLGRGPVAALACYVAMLFPVLGFVNVYFMRYSLVSDHWQYPACFAVIAAVVAGAAIGSRQLPRGVGYAAAVLLCLAACTGLGVLSWREAHVYRTNRALWSEVIRDNPRSALAHNNLGATFTHASARTEARSNYLRSIDLDPAAREGYVSMGMSYLREGRADDAAKWFRQAVGRDGSGHDPRIHLGEALLALDSRREAIECFEQTLAAEPHAPVNRVALAVLHESDGSPQRALELFHENARMYGDDPEAWFALASALRRRGSDAEAQAALADARRLSAGDHVTLTAMGSRLLVAGWPDLAAQALADAIADRPDYGPAHNHLGRAMEQMGRLDDAAAHFDRAIAVQPGFHEARMNLDRVLTLRAATTTPPTTTTRPRPKP